MARTQLVGTNGRIDFTLDGLTFRRTKSEAEARGVQRLHDVGWAQIDGASVGSTSTGKPLVLVRVVTAPAGLAGKHDPHAVKLKRNMADEATEFVALVNDEIATRRRWDAAAEA
ncbi:hypothetical protein GCM10009795_062860 [Nocardioides hankookensis]|uniref:Uncharacterized protein n=1 Tax=Nocardioides hankookensis TaxID=443157 RepID=A0ABW1LP92_9ACTN